MRLRTILLISALAACKSKGSSVAADGGPITTFAPSATATDADVSAASELATVAEEKRTLHPHSPAKSGETVSIPAGVHASGSMPGEPGREPQLEPALVPVSMNAFGIDALPYPNQEGVPPKTGVTQSEASQLCAERGERLCTELEWERACKGPEGDPFPTGNAWDSSCDRDSTSCVSGFNVRAMGSILEWTQSSFQGPGGVSRGSVVRGGGDPRGDVLELDRSTMRRCGRRVKGPTEAAPDVGFRCCKGPANTATIAPIELLKYPFRRTKLEASDFAKIVQQVPELKKLGTEIRFFDEEIAKASVGRSKVVDGFEFATNPILWDPEPGVTLLVTTGKAKTMSFIVAVYPLPGDKYRYASSFIFVNDQSPVGLMFAKEHRDQLLWSSCWGCQGEQGAVQIKDDHKVMIVQY